MIPEIQPEVFLVHPVQVFPQQQGQAVGGQIVQTGDRQLLHQLVHILLAHQLEQVLGLGMGRKSFFVQKAAPDIFRHVDVTAVKTLVQQAAVRDYIGRKQDPPGPGDPDGLPQGPELILLPVEVVEGPQQQGQVISLII